MRLAMLLLAAGRGSRFGGEVPKAWLPLAERTLVERSMARLLQVPLPPGASRQVVIAVHPADGAHLAAVRARLDALGAFATSEGGATRQQSMQRALAQCTPPPDVVLVHDAARPFFDPAAAAEALAAAQLHGAALLATPVPDTLKQVDGDGVVRATASRDGMWLAQTPQVVRGDLLRRGLELARERRLELTDDVALAELAGGEVRVVASDRRNLKITTAGDWELARAIAAAEDAGR